MYSLIPLTPPYCTLSYFLFFSCLRWLRGKKCHCHGCRRQFNVHISLWSSFHCDEFFLLVLISVAVSILLFEPRSMEIRYKWLKVKKNISFWLVYFSSVRILAVIWQSKSPFRITNKRQAMWWKVSGLL